MSWGRLAAGQRCGGERGGCGIVEGSRCGNKDGWEVAVWAGGPPWSGRVGDAGALSERGRAGPAAGDPPRVLGMLPGDGGTGLALERSRKRRGVCISSSTRMFHQRPQQTGARSTPDGVSGTSPRGLALCTPKGKPRWAWGSEGSGRQGWLSACPEAGDLHADASWSQRSLLHPAVGPEIPL